MNIIQQIYNNVKFKDVVKLIRKMTDQEKTQLIADLEGEITRHRELYYNTEPEVSDKIFDLLFDTLNYLSPDNLIIKKTGIKVPIISPWEKAKHEMPMFSLDKMHTQQELTSFALKVGESIFVIEEKLDGASLEIIYKNGSLYKAITRGDGYEGQDITRNVLKMKNVNSTVSHKEDFSLRSEIILCQPDFETINQLRIENNEKELVNLRNGASALSTRLDGTYSEYLTLRYYDVYGVEFSYEIDKLNFIKELGLIPVDYTLTNTLEEAYQVYLDYQKKRIELDHDIDGLVLKPNNLNKVKHLDEKYSNPKSQRAWKFPNIQIECQILRINWSIKQGDRINPVASVRPLFILLSNGNKERILDTKHIQQILGAKIGNVTLNNLDWIKEHNVGPKDIVIVERSNDIIPTLVQVVKKSGEDLVIPDKCPLCNDKTFVDNGFLYCANPACPAKELDILFTFINTYNILSLGAKTVSKLYELGLVHCPADFYKLSIDDIANIEGLGEKSANKMLSQLPRISSLVLFIEGLAIDGCKRATIEKIVESGFDTIEKLQLATIQDLTSIKSFADERSNTFINGLKARKSTIESLQQYITIQEERHEPLGSSLEGLSFCITGTLSDKREVFEQIIKRHKGKMAGVSKNLSYLIIGDNPGNDKLTKATALNIPTITERQLNDLIGGGK